MRLDSLPRPHSCKGDPPAHPYRLMWLAITCQILTPGVLLRPYDETNKRRLGLADAWTACTAAHPEPHRFERK